MRRIVPTIFSVQQHRHCLETEPVIYRPHSCPYCGFTKLWGHGRYERKGNRHSIRSGSLDPVLVPRYLCLGCRHTCSRLPECVPPRRWYSWTFQQLVLLTLLSGRSLNKSSTQFDLDRHTVRRWRIWLCERRDEFGLLLRSCFPELGPAMPLSGAMAWLDSMGLVVP